MLRLPLLQEYAARVRLFSRSARFFLAAAALGGIGGGVTNLLLNLYLIALGFTEASLPGFTRFGLVGAAGAALAGGPLVDWLGPRRSMLAGTALAVAGAVLLLVTEARALLGLALVASSAGGVLVYIAAPTFLVRHSSPVERPYLFGVATAAYVASTATGAGLGGLLPELWRALAPEWSQPAVYRASLLCGGILSATGIPLLWLATGERAARAGALPAGAAGTDRSGGAGTVEAADTAGDGCRDPEARSGGPLAGQLTTALRDLPARLMNRQFITLVTQFVLADGLIRIGGNLFIPYLNVFFVRHLGASEALFGSVRFVERALVVVATLLVALLVTRWGAVATIVATQLLSIPFLVALGFSPSVGVAAAVYLVRGPLMEMTQPTRDAFLMEVAPERTRATAFAALTLAGYVIGFGASYLAERLLGDGQFAYAFVVAGTLYAASAALYWLFFRNRPEAAPGRGADLAALATSAG
jgi:MFS family permease